MQITIFNMAYEFYAKIAVDWENYRTKSEFENQLAYKTLYFQLVNSYSALFYNACVPPYAAPRRRRPPRRAVREREAAGHPAHPKANRTALCCAVLCCVGVWVPNGCHAGTSSATSTRCRPR